MEVVTVEQYKEQATPKQVEALNRLMLVFRNRVAYERIEELVVHKGDYLAEVFTSYGSLVATVNLTKFTYAIAPEDNLVVAYGLGEFEDWLSSEHSQLVIN